MGWLGVYAELRPGTGEADENDIRTPKGLVRKAEAIGRALYT